MTCSLVLAVGVSVSVLLWGVWLPAAVIVPAGLQAGDTYHLAFVTDGTRDASSFLIADYNQFVTGEY